MQWLIRFAIGGSLVAAFAVIGDVTRPKGFAGLFAAAPSVALASLALTIRIEGADEAAVMARSMICGAVAFCVYATVCMLFLAKRHWPARRAAFCLLPIWGLAAVLLWWLLPKA